MTNRSVKAREIAYCALDLIESTLYGNVNNTGVRMSIEGKNIRDLIDHITIIKCHVLTLSFPKERINMVDRICILAIADLYEL